MTLLDYLRTNCKPIDERGPNQEIAVYAIDKIIEGRYQEARGWDIILVKEDDTIEFGIDLAVELTSGSLEKEFRHDAVRD